MREKPDFRPILTVSWEAWPNAGMGGDAVVIAPVSTDNSLLTGNFTRNFEISDP